MGLINLVAKFQIRPKTQDGNFVVNKGEIKVFGADDATMEVLFKKFPELTLYTEPSPSSSKTRNLDGSFLRSSQDGEIMTMDLAIAEITKYLGVLAEEEYTVVSAFKDELHDAGNEDRYKTYMWTMQK